VKLTAFDITVPAATVIGTLPDGWERSSTALEPAQ
jgi:hypothetical protein